MTPRALVPAVCLGLALLRCFPSIASANQVPARAGEVDEDQLGVRGPTPAEARGAVRAARVFLPGLLAYERGRAPARRLKDLTEGLRRTLTAQPPVSAPDAKATSARVVSVSSNGGRRGRVRLLALIAEGARRYTAQLTLIKAGSGRWLVAGVA